MKEERKDHKEETKASRVLISVSPRYFVLGRPAGRQLQEAFDPVSRQTTKQYPKGIRFVFEKSFAQTKVKYRSESGQSSHEGFESRVCGYLDFDAACKKMKENGVVDLSEAEKDEIWARITGPRTAYGRDYGTPEMFRDGKLKMADPGEKKRRVAA